MVAVLLTIHILVCIAMIGVILLQRSEGGGLGLGGGGGGVGGLMTGRGAANALTRTTVILATIFISTSIALALIAKRPENPLAPAIPSSSPLAPTPDATLLPARPPAPSDESPAQPQPSAPAPSSSTPIPAPAAPVPASPAPAAPGGAQPAPAPSGGGN